MCDSELGRQIRCFPYGERSDVPRLQQVEQKVVGRQRNLGLIMPLSGLWSQDGHILFLSFGFGLLAPKDFTIIWFINYARI